MVNQGKKSYYTILTPTTLITWQTKEEVEKGLRPGQIAIKQEGPTVSVRPVNCR